MNIAENIDCLKAMKNLPDKAFDLAVVDPPYFSGPERRGYYGCKVSKIGVRRDYPISPKWDIPTREYFDELKRGETGGLDRNQRRAYNPVLAQQRVQENFKRRGKTAVNS